MLPHKVPRNFIPLNRPDKPEKPYPDFPLFAHAGGVWAKKIRGKMHYFGPWADPEGALAKYLAEKDDLHAGRKPRPEPGAVTVKDLANLFLNRKQALLDAGELKPITWADYRTTCALVVGEFGKRRLVADLGPDDFAALRNKMAARWGPARLAVVIQNVRSLFKLAFDDGLADRPVRFGSGFARPSKNVLRLHRAKQGPKLFAAEEIRRMLDDAGPQLRAMILLGVNCGFGNADVGNLPQTALDLGAGWVNYPRPKTGINRRCPLWPETAVAVQKALAVRPTPKDPASAGLVFMTQKGFPWHKADYSGPLVEKVRKLLRQLGVGERKGLGFYTFRHVFETVAGESKDQIAIDFIMGHSRDDMASVYRERISDERLRAVAEHVRAWLFNAKEPG